MCNNGVINHSPSKPAQASFLYNPTLFSELVFLVVELVATGSEKGSQFKSASANLPARVHSNNVGDTERVGKQLWLDSEWSAKLLADTVCNR